MTDDTDEQGDLATDDDLPDELPDEVKEGDVGETEPEDEE